MPAVKITAALVDELGRTKAQIATLAEREKEIVDCLKKKGVQVYAGDLFEANVFETTTTSFKRKECLQANPKLAKILDKYTETKGILACKVQAKIAR